MVHLKIMRYIETCNLITCSQLPYFTRIIFRISQKAGRWREGGGSGGANFQGGGENLLHSIWPNVSRKLHEIERIRTQREEASLAPPLDQPLVWITTDCVILQNAFNTGSRVAMKLIVDHQHHNRTVYISVNV